MYIFWCLPMHNTLTILPRVINPRVGAFRNATNISINATHVQHKEEIIRILCSWNHLPLVKAGFIQRAIVIPSKASTGHATIIKAPSKKCYTYTITSQCLPCVLISGIMA